MYYLDKNRFPLVEEVVAVDGFEPQIEWIPKFIILANPICIQMR